MTVTAIVTNTCAIATITNVSFGVTSGIFTAPVNAPTPGVLSLLCTSGDPYSITIDGGLNPNPSFRQMEFTSGVTNYFIEYGLYSDSGYTTPWGNGINFGNGVSGVGADSPQGYTVYAQIPIQNLTPAPISGTYTDTVQVTITF
jgi:spore coat protein U-like protein